MIHRANENGKCVLCWASNGAPDLNTPLPRPRATAPPLVPRYRASFQSTLIPRLSVSVAGSTNRSPGLVACPPDLSNLAPSDRRATPTAHLMAPITSIQYPPAT